MGMVKVLYSSLLKILNSWVSSAPVHLYWEEILNDYIIPGKFDPTFMITHRVPIEDMAKLYAAFDKRQDGVSKVFVETKFSNPPTTGCPRMTRVDEWDQ